MQGLRRNSVYIEAFIPSTVSNLDLCSYGIKCLIKIITIHEIVKGAPNYMSPSVIIPILPTVINLDYKSRISTRQENLDVAQISYIFISTVH